MLIAFKLFIGAQLALGLADAVWMLADRRRALAANQWFLRTVVRLAIEWVRP